MCKNRISLTKTEELKLALHQTGLWNEHLSVAFSSANSSELIFKISAPMGSSFDAVRLAAAIVSGESHKVMLPKLATQCDERFSKVEFQLLYLPALNQRFYCGHIRNSLYGSLFKANKRRIQHQSNIGTIGFSPKQPCHGYSRTCTHPLDLYRRATVGLELRYGHMNITESLSPRRLTWGLCPSLAD